MRRGRAAAYVASFDVLRKTPDLWIDPFEVSGGVERLPRRGGLAADEAEGPATARSRSEPETLPNDDPVRRLTLRRARIDGAYIYPPSQPAASA